MNTYSYRGTPTTYQIEAVDKAIKRKSFGVFFEQRVGKTRVGIDYAGILHATQGLTRVLVVCPISALSAWETQIEEYLPQDTPREVVRFSPKEPLNFKCDKLTFLLVTYDLARIHNDILVLWKPAIIIADEVHKLKSHSSKRSRAMHRLAKLTPYRLGLTGTPSAQKPIDLFGVFRFIDPVVFGTSFPAFRSNYCIVGGYMHKQIIGYHPHALRELSAKIKDASIRVLRKDVLNEPEAEFITLTTPFDKEGAILYKHMRKHSLVNLPSGGEVVGDLPITRLLRLHQLAGGFLKDPTTGLVEHVSKAKITLAEQLISDLREDGEKIVIFCRFLAELTALERLCEKFCPVVTIHGGVMGAERDRRIALFQNPLSDVGIIILQQGAGNSGFSLAVSNKVIFYSMTFSVLEYLQARDRVMGREQISPVVTYYFLTIKNSVDGKIMGDIIRGVDVASQVSDRFKYYVEGEIE